MLCQGISSKPLGFALGITKNALLLRSFFTPSSDFPELRSVGTQELLTDSPAFGCQDKIQPPLSAYKERKIRKPIQINWLTPGPTSFHSQLSLPALHRYRLNGSKLCSSRGFSLRIKPRLLHCIPVAPCQPGLHICTHHSEKLACACPKKGGKRFLHGSHSVKWRCKGCICRGCLLRVISKPQQPLGHLS